MDEPARLSELISEIYDAAIEAERWPAALAASCAYVGGTAAMIFWQDSVLRAGGRYYSFGDDPHFTDLYFSKYIRLNPVIAIQHLVPVGEPTAVSALIPRREVVRTQFYREWMRPQNFIDNVFANLEKSATSYAAFAVGRGLDQGLVDEAALERMRLLVPHMRRAMLIGKVIDQQDVKSRALETVLDAMATEVFLLDADGAIVHANRRGMAMLDEARVLSAPHGRLRAAEATAQRALQQLCAAAAEGDAVLGTGGVALPLSGATGEVYLAHLLPLTSGDRKRMRTGAATAVFIGRATETTTPLEAAARRYGLTPREVQVLHGIIEIGGVREVAAALGISERTVKAHLEHLFDKTGVRRQSDLVKAVYAPT